MSAVRRGLALGGRCALAGLALAGQAACSAAQTGAERRPPPSPDPYVAVFRHVRPTVVLITLRIPSDDAAERRRGERDEAYGSGVVVASGAWGSDVLTDQHVVADATDVRVTFDDRTVVPGRVLAADTGTDVAVVRTAARDRPAATLGASAALEPGTAVGVAGYPIPDAYEDERLGTRASVFFGRVSSQRRDALELDVPIIPGESGGPIFDARTGVVVALAESRFDEEHAIGFGTPIEDAERFMRARKLPFAG